MTKALLMMAAVLIGFPHLVRAQGKECVYDSRTGGPCISDSPRSGRRDRDDYYGPTRSQSPIDTMRPMPLDRFPAYGEAMEALRRGDYKTAESQLSFTVGAYGAENVPETVRVWQDVRVKLAALLDDEGMALVEARDFRSARFRFQEAVEKVQWGQASLTPKIEDYARRMRQAQILEDGATPAFISVDAIDNDTYRGTADSTRARIQAAELALRQFSDGLDRLTTEDERNYASAVNRFKQFNDEMKYVLSVLASHWTVSVPGTTNALQRELLVMQSRDYLKSAMKAALKANLRTMLHDIKRLTPYYWGRGFEQLAAGIIRETENQLREVEKASYQELDNIRAFSQSHNDRSGTFIHYEPGPALKFLQKINSEKLWRCDGASC